MNGKFSHVTLLYQITLVTLLFGYVTAVASTCPANVIQYEHSHTFTRSLPPAGFLGAIDLQRHRHSVETAGGNNDIPWHCEQTMTWRDLGEGFFPRYLPEKRCLNGTCYYGHYNCKPVLTTVKVLSINQQNCRDPTLPPSLRRQWVLTDVETATYCQCSTL